MDFLRNFILLVTICSCAKVVYVAKQLPEQVFLIYGAQDNREILDDPKVPKEYKRKIKLIQDYKKYFYHYFGRKEEEIYSKTTFLEGEAVSYLVIASKFDQIKPRQECFPFVGCFPYLGFFIKDDAINYSRKLQEEDFHTWVRPVYAYSSLNYFTDPILSSFFVFNDFELAELIFHELFHTIFFIKDEVDLNENLANYFGRKLAFEYFKLNQVEIKKIEHQNSLQKELAKTITELAHELQQIYRSEKNLTKEKAKQELDNFMRLRFEVVIRQKCAKAKISRKECYPLRRPWNNASFAAFLTYEKDADLIGKFHLSIGTNLKDFYTLLEKKYKKYRQEDLEISFRDYLLKK